MGELEEKYLHFESRHLDLWGIILFGKANILILLYFFTICAQYVYYDSAWTKADRETWVYEVQNYQVERL